VVLGVNSDKSPERNPLIRPRRAKILEKGDMSASARRTPFTHEHYKYILRSGLDSGYKFISFSELGKLGQDQQLVCLRHDCDNDLTAAEAMARLEEEIGVRSTFFLMLRSAMYNLLSIPNAELARKVIRRGHDIGLHFDEQYYPNATPTQLVAYVDWERAFLSREFGVPVEVVSFHQPSQRVLENRVRTDCISTHDRNYMKGVHYISDSNMVWKKRCPIEFFLARKHPRLQLLIHPEWWTPEEMTVQQKWNQMLLNNFELIQQSLLRRERTYTQRQEIEFMLLECDEIMGCHLSGSKHRNCTIDKDTGGA